MAAFNQAEDVKDDCILVQTDCTFNIALIVIKSLSNDNVLQVCSYKVVTIDNIESNDPDDHYSLRFGGGKGRYLQYFAKTASSVLRMMMLESVNASRWRPGIGKHSDRRNRQKMQFQRFVQPGHREFVIAATKSAAEEYYTYYDHLHPHFKIEHEISFAQSADDGWRRMPQSMMLIFRRNFTEVIEIDTSLWVSYQPNAWPWTGPGTFHSKAQVGCFVRDVTNPDHDGLRFLQVLKNTSGYQDECLTLAGLLGQIAQRLPFRQEEDDHSDESEEEDALTPLVPQEMQGNHQPHVVPALLQQMPPPVPVHVNQWHQLRAAPDPALHVQQMPQVQELHAALVPQRMPPPPQVQGPHVALVRQRMPPPPQVQEPHVAPARQQMPPPPQNLLHVNHQPHGHAVPATQQMPPPVRVHATRVPH